MIREYRFRAFTILEFLIVIVIIGILAAIAVPNFMEAQVRSKQSKTYSPTRSLATALECYYVDYGEYPAMRPLRSLDVNLEKLEKMGAINFEFPEPGGLPGGPAGLTTPIAYIKSIPIDDFAPEGIPFCYYSDGKGWIIFSPGPDKDYDIDPVKDYDGSTTKPIESLIVSAYDATNGTISSGDVWRIRQ